MNGGQIYLASADRLVGGPFMVQAADKRGVFENVKGQKSACLFSESQAREKDD